MKRIGMAVLWVMLLAVPALAGSKEVQKEPELKVSEAELTESLDEHGLKRLGDFGRFHLFGYGELHYNNNIGSSADEFDFHRFVIGVGFDFTDKILLRSELDFEHAFKEPELEFAYLDFLINEAINVRAGSILVPMGVMNQLHEPPTFNGVERPALYTQILPTSWMEAGAGIHGQLPLGFDYQLYGMSSLTAVTLNAAGTAVSSSFNGSNGLRGGRFKVGNAPGRDMAIAGRLQNTGIPGLRLGSSFFAGNTGQGRTGVGGAFLAMLEGDAKYSFEGIDLEGLVAFSTLKDADNINTVLTGAGSTNFVGRQMLGWYLEGAYHLFHHLLPSTKHDLVAFGRYEDFDTQFKMPGGFAKNQANDRHRATMGLTYRPIPQVAVKADYNWNWNDANSSTDQFNVGLGFYY